jgi:hypothetical protein
MAALGMLSIFPLAGKISLIATRSRMHFMNAINAGSRDPVATFGMARKKSRKSLFLRFMAALKESRRREARRVIASYAHLLSNRDPWDDDNRHRDRPRT